MTPSILVLCSGGMKSAFLLALAKKEVDRVGILFIDHGQVAVEREYQAVCNLGLYYGLTDECHKLVISEVVPKGEDWPRFKLTLLLWYAVIWARKWHFERIYFGPSADDYREEATLKYVNEMRKLLDTAQPEFAPGARGIRCERVKLDAPLIKLTEDRVLKLGETYAVPWELTWCCERGEFHHCGTCRKCIRRQKAFEKAKLLDPTHYKLAYIEVRAKAKFIGIEKGI